MKNFAVDTFDEADKKAEELKKLGYNEFYVAAGETAEQFAKDFIEAAHSPIFTKRNPLFFAQFNGKFIFNDDLEHLNVDSIFELIVGCSIEQQKIKEQKWLEEYERREREFKEKIPTLTEQYIEKGHKILDECYWKKWDEVVPIRLGDLYHGMELDNTLELIKMLKDNKSFDEVYTTLDNQGHSGMSFHLMKCMLLSFGGESFVKYIEEREK